MNSRKAKKWRVKSHRPKSMPPEIMEFVDPFDAEDEEKACFVVMSILHYSLYRDEQMKTGRTAKNILTELGYSVVRV